MSENEIFDHFILTEAYFLQKDIFHKHLLTSTAAAMSVSVCPISSHSFLFMLFPPLGIIRPSFSAPSISTMGQTPFILKFQVVDKLICVGG